jgi:hypothetical protein
MIARKIVAGIAIWVLAGCASNQTPKWTLWYIPNGTTAGIKLSKVCHTLIFASAPDAKTFRVVVMKRLATTGIDENQAYLQAGDNFTGLLDLGPATVHNDSSGYDINVDVVYKIDSYVAAKARADADCPPPAKRAPVVRPSPKPSPQPTHT